eukprot:evm.model.scf_1272.3 EVM.evm.TU.scf_1272.3   scf_1272:13025-17427(+)
MVKKSTKSRSKRVPLRRKYNIIKKVKERARKARRDGKRAAKGGAKPRKAKDPGVPQQWPFRDEFLKEMAFERDRILDEAKKKREERRRLRKVLLEDSEPSGIEAVQSEAAEKQEEHELVKRIRHDEDSGEGRQVPSKGTFGQGFYNEFRKVVEAADVVIEVLDARDPLACRSEEAERFVRKSGTNKKIILLLNKIDLVPCEAVQKWLKYLRAELPTLAFKSSTQKQRNNLGRGNATQLAGSGGLCLGADNLLRLLKNYSRNSGMKTAITIGIIGMPNVGKSSVINSLKRARVVHAGNKPGTTTTVQEVHLDKHIRLLDSPGIVLTNKLGLVETCGKAKDVDDPSAVVEGILGRVPSAKLSKLYHVSEFSSVGQFLQQLALARGKLRKGGVPDTDVVARVVMQDWNGGVIPFYTMPPERRAVGSVRVVSEWGKDFAVDEELEAGQASILGQLPSLANDGGRFIEATSACFESLTLAPDEEMATGPSQIPQCVQVAGTVASDAGHFPGGSRGAVANKGEVTDSGDVKMAGVQSTNPRQKLHFVDAAERRNANLGASTNKQMKKASRDKGLYTAEGQLDPHKARAERRKGKKLKKGKMKQAMGVIDAVEDMDAV